jgi:hypothetical protein
VLGFLSTMDTGTLAPVPVEEDAPSEAAEWDLRERTDGEEERRAEAEGLGAEVEEPLFVTSPSCMASAEQ